MKARKVFSLVIRLGMTLIFILGLAAGPAASPASADTQNGSVYLHGSYVEAGVNAAGYFGASGTPPAGFHPANPGGLSIVADYGKDGWTAGTPPFTGDFFLPGQPEMGFALKFNGASKNWIMGNNANTAYADGAITPDSLAETSDDTIQRAVWQGHVSAAAAGGEGSYHLTRTITLDPDGSAVNVTIQVTNTGGAALTGLKYLESFDPDQTYDWNGSFATRNAIIAQPGGGADLAYVAAGGNLLSDLAVALATHDTRARVAVGGAAVTDPDQVLAAAACTPDLDTVCATPPGAATLADVSISLAYNLGDLPAGESASLSFSYLTSAPPKTTLTSTPPNPSGTSVHFDFAAQVTGSTIAGYECSLDSAAWAACLSPQPYSGLSLGQHAFKVRARSADEVYELEPASYTWNVVASSLLVINITGSGSGTVEKSPDWDSYPNGTSLTLTPHAAPGSHFAGWSGDQTGSAAPLTFTINANTTLTAAFDADLSADLSAAVSEPVVSQGKIVYTLTISNAGPDPAGGATVLAGFGGVSATWTCAGSGGAVCAHASGAGDLVKEALSGLPKGGSAVFTISLARPAAFQASVSAPVGVADPDPSDNTAATQVFWLMLPGVYQK